MNHSSSVPELFVQVAVKGSIAPNDVEVHVMGRQLVAVAQLCIPLNRVSAIIFFDSLEDVTLALALLWRNLIHLSDCD